MAGKTFSKVTVAHDELAVGNRSPAIPLFHPGKKTTDQVSLENRFSNSIGRLEKKSCRRPNRFDQCFFPGMDSRDGQPGWAPVRPRTVLCDPYAPYTPAPCRLFPGGTGAI